MLWDREGVSPDSGHLASTLRPADTLPPALSCCWGQRGHFRYVPCSSRMACVPHTHGRAHRSPAPWCTSLPALRPALGPAWNVNAGRQAPGVLTSLSWSRELLRREPVASRKLSSSLLRSPPLDTATFIWGQGETGSASADLTPPHCWPAVRQEGAGPGQAPNPRLQRAGAERCRAIHSQP